MLSLWGRMGRMSQLAHNLNHPESDSAQQLSIEGLQCPTISATPWAARPLARMNYPADLNFKSCDQLAPSSFANVPVTRGQVVHSLVVLPVVLLVVHSPAHSRAGRHSRRVVGHTLAVAGHTLVAVAHTPVAVGRSPVPRMAAARRRHSPAAARSPAHRPGAGGRSPAAAAGRSPSDSPAASLVVL